MNINKFLSDAMNPAQQILTKVPKITVYFWIIKVLTTGMGEVFSDYLMHTVDPIIAIVLGLIGLTASLVLQFSVRRYIPWVYWLTIVMVSIFGTMAADVLHVGLGISYQVSTTFLMAALVIIFVAWYVCENTLSIHSIYTHRREAFYWSTVLVTFALGTAVGDLTAKPMNLGYLSSGIMFAIVIIIPAVAYCIFGMNEILTFWFAYIITRPLGASFADWLSAPITDSGLGVGTGPVSFVLTIFIIGLIGYMTVTRKDVKDEHAAYVQQDIVVKE